MLNGLQPAHLIIVILAVLLAVIVVTGAAVGLYALIRHLVRQGRR